MPQDSPKIVPNFYSHYAGLLPTLTPNRALAEAVTALLSEKKFAAYKYETGTIYGTLPTQNPDSPGLSVTIPVSTKTGQKLGYITFKVNETTQEIETSYSNEILEAVFQPLFSGSAYSIYRSKRPAEQNWRNMAGTEASFRQFYASPEALQFAAKTEEIRHLYQEIKTKHPALKAMGNKKILKRGFFGQVQEKETTLRGGKLTEDEKIIAEINEIAQTKFFRTLSAYGPDLNSPGNKDMLKQRLNILKALSQILDGYSKETSPDKNTINELRLAVKELDQLDNHAESETQRIASAIGMGIGIPAFIGGIVLLVFLSAFPVWVAIAAPILLLVGGLIAVWSIMAFQTSFPQGLAKDLYFVADKMEAELDKKSLVDFEPHVVPQQTTEIGPTLDQATVNQEAYKPMFADPPNEENSQASELFALLQSACEGLEPKEQKHLANGLNEFLASKKRYNFDELHDEITKSKGKASQFELLCTAFNISPKIEEEPKKHL